MSGTLSFSESNPLRIVITDWQNRNANDMEYKLFKDFSEPHKDAYFQPFLQTDTLNIQFLSSFDTTNNVLLKNHATGATISTESVTIVLVETTYYVCEYLVDISSLNGTYYLQFEGSDTDTETYTAVSEPFEVRASYNCDTTLIEQYNNEAAFGIDYRTNITMYYRVKAVFNQVSNETNSDIFIDSGGTRSFISSIKNRRRVFQSLEQIPLWMVDKINTSLSHDYCAINGQQVVTGQVLPYDVVSYKALWAEPSEVLDLASGSSGLRNTHDGGERITLTLTYTATARSASEANAWQSITYGNGLFVAVSIDGTNRVMTSPDGITWTARSASEANAWQSITYGNGLFVAVSGSGTNRVMTSPDGITWTARSASEANAWKSIAYGNGLFVAVSSTGTNRVMTSPDGITWTARSASEANAWQSVTYANGLFVAVSSSGTNRVMTSPDGITWTARSASEANQWYSVTYANGLFVAVSIDGTNRVMTSPDGITWTARSASEANQWFSVTYGNGLFVAVSSSGTNRVMTSPDGITWTARSASEANFWYSITYGNGLFVAVSGSGTNRVMNITYLYE